MEPFTKLTGIVAPLEALNVDTDQIIPKQFLKRIERTGYEDCLFFDWRFREDGTTPNPDFELNAPRYAGATILLTKDNFGCGSSREHAPWALHDYGFRCILAPSYADIFYNNCFNNGLLPIVLPGDTIQRLFDAVRAAEGYALTVDLAAQTVATPSGETIGFDIDAFLKERLLNGWDQIALTLRHEAAITAFESAR
jgi:3-isopropylmalate/(R)-2-methylmalate dehydratase small subunit